MTLCLFAYGTFSSVRYAVMHKQSVTWSRPFKNCGRNGKPDCSSWINSLSLFGSIVSHNMGQRRPQRAAFQIIKLAVKIPVLMQDSPSLVRLNNKLANNNNTDVVIVVVIVSSYCFGSVTWGKCVKSIFCIQISGICHVFSHSGLEIQFAEIENDLMTLSIMLKSPHSVELRLQMEDWAQSLQDLGKVDIQKTK